MDPNLTSITPAPTIYGPSCWTSSLSLRAKPSLKLRENPDAGPLFKPVPCLLWFIVTATDLSTSVEMTEWFPKATSLVLPKAEYQANMDPQRQGDDRRD
jgi:hypothetical protein